MRIIKSKKGLEAGTLFSNFRPVQIRGMGWAKWEPPESGDAVRKGRTVGVFRSWDSCKSRFTGTREWSSKRSEV